MEPTNAKTDAVIELLALAPLVIAPLIRDLPEARRKERPAPGKWSAHEHVCHLPVVQDLMIARFERMLAEPGCSIRPYDPASDAEHVLLHADLEDALSRYQSARAELLIRLRALSMDEWRIAAQHPEYADYSVFTMFRHLGIHDMHHAGRVEELLLAR